MKSTLAGIVAAVLLSAATPGQAFFGGNDWGDWGGDWNPYDEWDPRYWMEEMEDVWDDDDDYYGGRRGPYGYGGGPYGGGPYGGYGPYGPPPGYGYGGGYAPPPPMYGPPAYGPPAYGPPAYAPAPAPAPAQTPNY